MKVIIWIAIGLIFLMFGGAFAVAWVFNKDEIPKVVGSGFGALISAGIAFLISSLARQRELARASADQLKLEKAYWVDTWNTLPAVCEEYIYWKSRSGQDIDGEDPAMRPKAFELIVEHLRSTFFEANLASIYRLPSDAQTLLIVFHDNLRVARERVAQITVLLVAHEKERTGSTSQIGSTWIGLQPQSFPTVPMTLKGDAGEHQSAWFDIIVLCKELAEVLESALLHGWDAHEALEGKRGWQKESTIRDDRNLPAHIPAWIGTIAALRRIRERVPPPAVPDDKQ